MKSVCKMTGKEVVLPCSYAGCPLFGDCLAAYEKATTTASPQTNADHIRSMTDEELAAELSVNCRWCVYQPLRKCPKECESGVLAWLKQPYKEEV